MDVDSKTITDFGKQWTTYDDSSGFFGSTELLADFISPFQIGEFKDKRVADIGAGTGRFVLSLLDAGAAQVIAVEPSQAIEVVRTKTSHVELGRVIALNIRGDQITPNLDLDYAISIGVLHHVSDPGPVVKAVYESLKPGGKFIVWLYGKEGNQLYLALVLPIRIISKRLPHWGKALLARLLDYPLAAYIGLCKLLPSLPLPLRDYMASILGRLEPAKRRLVIYDQLNPQYAKYYTHDEACNLMKNAPFHVAVHHRRGYSWVVIGTKPIP
jgi:SAM-dependent methyltransferase